jgi:prepilin-type N-terminal cleavage/methylation domain-containing protein/prepilin-type processing-associated H-X9-DG protein
LTTISLGRNCRGAESRAPVLGTMMPRASSITRGFTLIEVLVVVSIIALLIAILVPALGRARTVVRRTMCLGNLHQVGLAIHGYAQDHNGCIPYGPEAPPMTVTNLYPTTGAVTSLISLESGKLVALGLTLPRQLARTPKVLFCPDADQGSRADAELANVGRAQAQADYYYRHGSGSSMYADAGTEHIRLASLGRNSDGAHIRALAIDANYLVDPFLEVFKVYLRTNHRMETVSVLFADGHAAAVINPRGEYNPHGEYTVDARDNPRQSFARILRVFERADRLP